MGFEVLQSSSSCMSLNVGVGTQFCVLLYKMSTQEFVWCVLQIMTSLESLSHAQHYDLGVLRYSGNCLK